MTPRRDLARQQYRVQRAIDERIAKPMMRTITAEARKHEGPMTQDARRAILRATDRALDSAYGERPGGPSELLTIITEASRAAALLPVRDAVMEMRAKLPDDLVTRMEEGASEVRSSD